MKISIIIPIYNTSKYLKRCLNSIINQTYKNLEIICVNDGSTDNSLDILNYYAKKDSRIKVINKKNEGVSKARNVGLDNATGDLIGFVDSDDAIMKDMYEFLVKNLEENNASISACDFYKVKDDQIINYGYNDSKKIVLTGEEVIKDFLKDNKLLYIGVTKIFKKELIENIRFNEQLTHSEDRLFLYEIYKKNVKIVKYNVPKYIYYSNPASATNEKFKETHKSIIKSASIICEDVLSKYPNLKEEALLYKFESLIMFIRKLELANNKNEYINYYNEIRKEIISLSKKIKISKKRKLEVFILKYLNFIYYFFANKLSNKKRKTVKNNQLFNNL